jgi:maltose alpha-D-glucosyltransferase/alpha-amylase
MKYLDVRTKEGGYQRTGSRTPMQWDHGKNHGFSDSDEPYLPTDSSADAPVLSDQINDPDSLYSAVKELIRLRHEYADLHAGGGFEIVYAEHGKLPFVYRRGSLLIAVNPSLQAVRIPCGLSGSMVYGIGAGSLEHGELSAGAQSFSIFSVL